MAQLFPERRLSRIRGWARTARGRLELLTPRIQQPPTDPEFLREFDDVLALIQSVHRHLPKGLRKLPHTFLGHLTPPSGASVPIRRVSF